MAKLTTIQRGIWFMIPFLMGLILLGINKFFTSANGGAFSTIAIVFIAVGGVGMLVCLIENALKRK